MGSGAWRKTFCKTCGVPISNETADLSDEEIAALPEIVRNWRVKCLDLLPLNLRTLNGFDFKSLPTRIGEGKKLGKPYVNPS